MTFTLATRKSKLALWQAETTRDLLRAAWPDLDVQLLCLESSGDQNQTEALERFGRIGIFTVEVDRAVIEGRADAAVHSMKDMTTTLMEGVRLAGVLPRGPVEDAWVSPTGVRLDDLPAGSRVATGSMRRRSMLLARRPDIEPVGIRGNVDTRLRKLAAGEADAMILARAGLVRLGLDAHLTEVLDTTSFLPAVGQGLVGITCRQEDDEARRRLHAITDLEARDAALAERSLLRDLRGGCNVPVGAHARVKEGTLSMRARVLSLDGRETIEGEITGNRDHATQLGSMLADDLLQRGAERLIEEARG